MECKNVATIGEGGDSRRRERRRLRKGGNGDGVRKGGNGDGVRWW